MQSPASDVDAAARELASGAKLGDALARVGYPAAKSAAYHVRGGTDDAAMRGALVPRYCQGVNDPALVEIGVHRAGNETWVVMAGRTETPFTELRDPAAVARRVLDLVNEARGAARRCGRNRFEPARQIHRVADRLVKAVMRAALEQVRLLLVLDVVIHVPELVIDREELFLGGLDAHLDAHIVLFVHVPGARVADDLTIARAREHRALPERVRQLREAQ